MTDCLTGLGKGSRHISTSINPQDRKVRCSDVHKSMRLICRHKRRVKGPQSVTFAVNLRFGLAFEDRHLLITVMRVQRNLCTDGANPLPGRCKGYVALAGKRVSP